MNAEEIIVKLCDNAKSTLTVWGVFAEAFDERDPVELLKKRAFLIEHCEYVLKELKLEEEELGGFKDVFEALSHNNLKEQMNVLSDLLTPTHKVMVRSTFKFYGFKQVRREHDVQELVNISRELRDEICADEDLTQEQKEVLLDVCNAVEQSKDEHDMVGNHAISKLHERLVGKAMLSQNVFSSIKNKVILEKVKKLYAEVQKVNEIMGFLISMGDKFQKVLGFLN